MSQPGDSIQVKTKYEQGIYDDVNLDLNDRSEHSSDRFLKLFAIDPSNNDDSNDLIDEIRLEHSHDNQKLCFKCDSDGNFALNIGIINYVVEQYWMGLDKQSMEHACCQIYTSP